MNVESEEELEILDVGRCYQPLATPNRPIITQVDWKLLGIASAAATVPAPDFRAQSLDRHHGDSQSVQSPSVGGLFVNTAHFGDGVTLSLGSGKVMSELLLGLQPSVDVPGSGLYK